MKLTCFMKSGYFKENSYLIEDEITGMSAIVDPGFMDVSTLDNIPRIDYVLITHGHFDHIATCNYIKEKYGAKIVSHTLEVEVLCNPVLNLSDKQEEDYYVNPDLLVNDGDTIKIGEMNVKVMHVPGHTIGSVFYFLENAMFTGDTLIKGRIGRTDLPTVHYDMFMDSLEKIKKIDGEYTIYSGHDEGTDLSHEKATNKFLN